MTAAERHQIRVFFFAASDGIVLENLTSNVISDAPLPSPSGIDITCSKMSQWST